MTTQTAAVRQRLSRTLSTLDELEPQIANLVVVRMLEQLQAACIADEAGHPESSSAVRAQATTPLTPVAKAPRPSRASRVRELERSRRDRDWGCTVEVGAAAV